MGPEPNPVGRRHHQECGKHLGGSLYVGACSVSQCWEWHIVWKNAGYTSDPQMTFSSDDVSNFLKDLINMQTVPGPNDVDQLLYCVIMPVGVSSDQSNVIGEHFSPDEDILCAWVMNDGTLDSVTTLFSHELVEACTNPHGDGYQFDAPGQCSASPINWCEIGDICEGIRDTVNGVVVQEYWSASDSACIAPGSNVTN